MNKSKINLRKFTNPSGETSWRVSGTINGKRIRRNFATCAEATAYRQDCEIERLNADSEGQTVWTTLTQDENRDAIAASNLLKRNGSKRSLTFAVNYFLKHFSEASVEATLTQAVDEYVAIREKDFTRGSLSVPMIKSIRWEMKRLSRELGDIIVNEIRYEMLETYLDRMPSVKRSGAAKTPSLKTWNNRRGFLNTFFEWCVKKQYVAENPVKKVQQFSIKRRRATAETLSADQARKLMHFIEGYTGPNYKVRGQLFESGTMVPFFALALFAGIRPDWRDGEITKIKPRDIDRKMGFIRIEPDVSKVNEKRHIKIQPNLDRWLEKYPLTEVGAVPKVSVDTVIRDIRTRFNLGYDVLRHTYISMTVGAFRSVGDAALQAGNSEPVIRRHYLDLKSQEEADAFWHIMPQGETLPTMTKHEGRYVIASE